jgi:hypothetical protein
LAKRNFSAIRHLASTMGGKRVAAGEYEVVVSVWDLKTRRCISEFETPLDPGGHRLAINPRGDICAVGSWQHKGVALYSAGTGDLITARDGLGQVRGVSFSADGCRIYCCSGSGPCTVLDGKSGAVLGKYHRLEKVFSDRFQDLELRVPARAKSLELSRPLEGAVATFDRATFAVLDADFGPDRVCLSESGGPVRCIATEDGRVIWNHIPPAGTHVLTLAYSEASSNFYGVQWPYVRGGPMSLLQLDYHSGNATVVASLGHFALAVFCSHGDRLLTSEGEVFNVVSGVPEKRFSFPPGARPER